MCMVDCSDGPVTSLSSADHKARKEHKCAECRRVIRVGETYRSDRYLFESEFNIHKVCAHCMVVRWWLSDECGGWLYNGLEEDLQEHAASGDYAMDVKRLYVAMRRKWARRDGQLRPVPSRRPLTSMERNVIDGMMTS